MSVLHWNRTYDNLEGVHPLLCAVIIEGILDYKSDHGLDVVVIEGGRSRSRQRKLFDAGKSWTLDSNHLYGIAVDVAIFDGKQVSWHVPLYADLAASVDAVATRLNCDIVWGGNWQQVDAGHFQLPQHYRAWSGASRWLNS